MTSMFQAVLGAEFGRLHPRLQRRFSVGLASGEACIGTGVMERIVHGGRFVKPFLALGGTRHILCPREGTDVPFRIENVPYADSHGRETVSFVRTFRFPDGDHRFDAQMVLGADGDRIIDYLGTHQHLASELHLSVDGRGGLVIRSGTHRFREGPVDLRVPGLVGGDAEVRERYDDESDSFRIRVRVTNRRFGLLFGYDGSFTCEFHDAGVLGVRAGLRPVREEARQ